MKNKPFLGTIIIALVLLALLTLLFPDLMISPGKLIDGHAKLTKDCFVCHTPFRGLPSSKCIACHKLENIDRKVQKKRLPFHQLLREHDCVTCHSDHKGVTFFQPATRFAHDLLASKFQKQCHLCHRKPRDTLHLKIEGHCDQCHTPKAWRPATFDHEKYFRFDRHHPPKCLLCHPNNAYSSYTCYGCHEHSPQKMHQEHAEKGIYNYENCVKCHPSGKENETRYPRRYRNENDLRFYPQGGRIEEDHEYEDEERED